MRGYTPLTLEERSPIYILEQASYGQTEIANMLGRHKSTINRELQRNQGLTGYRPKQAHDRAVARRREKARPRMEPTAWTHIAALMRQKWRPDQITGRLAREHGMAVRHEWIYQLRF